MLQETTPIIFWFRSNSVFFHGGSQIQCSQFFFDFWQPPFFPGAGLEILNRLRGSVTVWQSSLSPSSSSSLKVHVKYLTEYENCCCWSPSASATLGFRFCFRLGLETRSEVVRCGGRGRNTWMTSSASLLSPVRLALSGFTGKTISWQTRIFRH